MIGEETRARIFLIRKGTDVDPVSNSYLQKIEKMGKRIFLEVEIKRLNPGGYLSVNNATDWGIDILF